MSNVEFYADAVCISETEDGLTIDVIDVSKDKSSGSCRVKISGDGSVSCHSDSCGGTCELKTTKNNKGTEYRCECKI